MIKLQLSSLSIKSFVTSVCSPITGSDKGSEELCGDPDGQADTQADTWAMSC